LGCPGGSLTASRGYSWGVLGRFLFCWGSWGGSWGGPGEGGRGAGGPRVAWVVYLANSLLDSASRVRPNRTNHRSTPQSDIPIRHGPSQHVRRCQPTGTTQPTDLQDGAKQRGTKPVTSPEGTNQQARRRQPTTHISMPRNATPDALSAPQRHMCFGLSLMWPMHCFGSSLVFFVKPHRVYVLAPGLS
jgi:hypothetical protein